jgi:hypothetical protein
MKASLIAHDFRKLHKMSKQKIVKMSMSKVAQNGLHGPLEILGINK